MQCAALGDSDCKAVRAESVSPTHMGRYPSFCRYTVALLVPCVKVYGAVPGQEYGIFLAEDFEVSCDEDIHKIFHVLAWVLFFVVPLGFPFGLWLHFRRLNSHRQLWIQVHATTDRGLFCDDN